MAFVPQEDSAQLLALRSMLTPFHEAVTKALAFELEDDYLGDLDTEAAYCIVEKILQNLPTENPSSNFASWSHASEALELEFDHLLNLQ